MGKIILILLFILVGSFLCALGQVPLEGRLAREPHLLRTFDGREHPADLFRLSVREDRSDERTNLIKIAFVRLATRAAKPGAPIVFLAGGPGIPGIGLAQVPVYFSLFERLRETADVILLDQRGTGLSIPNLQCPQHAFTPEVFSNAEVFASEYANFVRTCVADWRSKGVDLDGYNSNASADDIEDIRRAIGAERLSLLGWSYGTELALATVRRHGSKIDRIVLASTRGPDNLLKLPSIWDDQVTKLSRLVAADPRIGKQVPDLQNLMKEAFRRLERSPIEISVTDQRAGKPVRLRVGKIGLQTLVRADLSDARSFVALPALLWTISEGDYSILTRRIEQLYNGFASSAMSLATDCSTGWSPARRSHAEREASTALITNVNLQWKPEICALTGVKDLGAESRSMVKSVRPALFISGSLDPNAPAAQADAARRGFKNGVHLLIENAAHEFLPAPEVQSVIFDFMNGTRPSAASISLAAPRFLSIDEAKAPPQRR